MTRINIIPPELLTDGQLFSEYREAPRVINKIASGKRYKQQVPETFTYSTGHETFFSNKLLWLRNRHLAVRRELLRRANTQDGKRYPIDVRAAYRTCQAIAPDLCNDWQPTEQELYYSLGRLFHRILGYKTLDKKDGMVVDPMHLATDPWTINIVKNLGSHERVLMVLKEATTLYKQGVEYT